MEVQAEGQVVGQVRCPSASVLMEGSPVSSAASGGPATLLHMYNKDNRQEEQVLYMYYMYAFFK